MGGILKWRINTPYLASPAISNDTIFAQAKFISAINAKTGTIYWSTPTTYEQGLGVLYYKNMVFTAYQNANKVVAFNATNGKQVWEFSGGTQDMPVISNGILYCKSSTGGGGTLFALDAKTGVQKWIFKTQNFTTPAIAVNGTTFIESGSPYSSLNPTGYLYAIDSNSGTLKWTFTFPGETGNYHTRPIIVGGLIYFLGYQNMYGATNTLYAVDMKGSLTWSKTTSSGAIMLNLTGSTNGIYTTTYGNTNKFDPLTGTFLASYASGYGTDNPDVTITPTKTYSGISLGNGVYYNMADIATGALLIPGLSSSNFWGYIIVINGIAYYPGNNAMNYVN